MEFDREKVERYFRGEDPGVDETYINDVFCDNSKEKQLRKFLAGQFNEMPKDEENESKNLDHILYKIHYDINSRLSTRKTLKLPGFIRLALSVAGAILIPLVIFMGLKMQADKARSMETLVEIKAPAWTRARFILPDGTTGWLNSNSSITYTGNFTKEREVALTGEAYFDVAKDPKRPFVVNTPEIRARVLGTRFNLASYGNENIVEVVLEEGGLEFSCPDGRNACLLKPDDLLTFHKSSGKFSTSQVQAQKYTAWTLGKLVFRNDPLDVVARRLARWYNVDVELKAGQFDNLRWRATFVDDNLEEVLAALKRSLHVDYRIEKSSMNPDNTYPRKKIILTVKPA
jgi:transmembrane sensor